MLCRRTIPDSAGMRVSLTGGDSRGQSLFVERDHGARRGDKYVRGGRDHKEVPRSGLKRC